MAQFIRQNLEPHPGSALPTAVVFKRFTEFLETGKHRPMSDQTFNAKLLGHPSLEGRVEAKILRATTKLYTLPQAVPGHSFRAFTGLRWKTDLATEEPRDCWGCGKPLLVDVHGDGLHPECGGPR
jgi:hypothetical protein